MLLHEAVQRCPRCEEVTPHSRRVLPLRKVLGAAGLATAAWCWFQDADLWPLAALLLAAALFTLLRDRERLADMHCERCRGKQLAELRRKKPTLDGDTEISIF